ncbi:hypothetical protein LZ30DRAFT_734869 [Colletotrichum cereale]|nr:hypothetical protein LZ30DRAFT_734869 [Colletotrichum cereale]
MRVAPASGNGDGILPWHLACAPSIYYYSTIDNGKWALRRDVPNSIIRPRQKMPCVRGAGVRLPANYPDPPPTKRFSFPLSCSWHVPFPWPVPLPRVLAGFDVPTMHPQRDEKNREIIHSRNDDRSTFESRRTAHMVR